MLEELKALAGRGFALHWLKPKSKAPVRDEWSTAPVQTVAELERSHRDNFNVGVRLGEHSLIGDLYLHVIDVDIRGDEHADDALEALHDLFPDIDDYPVVQSGSGGASRHFYILSDTAFASRKLARSKGWKMVFDDKKQREVKKRDWEIELFGTGKQVAMPPSIHPDSGKPYRWLREFDFDDLDLGLGPIVSAEALIAAGAVEASGSTDSGDDTDMLLALARQPPQGLTEEEMRDAVFALDIDEWCEDRDGWLKVGMALHHETNGSDLGFKIWCDFSERSEKFDLRNSKQVWRSFRQKTSSSVTMATVLKEVREEGSDFAQLQQKLEIAATLKKALADVSLYDLSPIEMTTILPRLKKLAEEDGLKASDADLRRTIKEQRKEAVKESEQRRRKSLEDWLADETLRLFFNEGDHLLFLDKLFWAYDKGLWRPYPGSVVDNRVYRLITKVLSGGDENSKALLAVLEDSGRADTLNALSNSVRGIIEKKCGGDGTEDPMRVREMPSDSIMNCRNGELWFEDDDYDFRKHDPSNRLTGQLATDYDPMAECPEWDAAIARIMRDQHEPDLVIRHLYEVMGYLVQTTRDMACWVMFYGTGSNGKSFVTSVLQELLGANSSVSQSLRDFGSGKSNHAESSLVGKLLMVDDDFEKGLMLPDGTLKKFSESKRMTANPKYGSPFNFVCRATPLILTNHWPKTADLSYGLTRRALVFHFNTTLVEAEVDRGLLTRIRKNELPGILNHLIEGWERLKARGRFDVPVACERAKSVWLGRRNVVAAFISEHIEATGNDQDRERAADVWDTFQAYVQNENAGNKWGRNNFYDELCSVPGITKYTPKGVLTFRGLVLKKPEFDPFDDNSDEDGLGSASGTKPTHPSETFPEDIEALF
ncbi:DNA primase/polymerase [Achromobacter phage vB_AchrS_AchV4]|uniref:DNA primase/polymerase n=1 Tax=Achromobacter phage vB_AchrS_AchV4 TaxID=2796514 RepID=A0A7T3PGU4_9CAUD|nr:DNA primase [Achromobacter phage vB_AchrS_AchV4]QPZ53239.1 DNA primase/polymerase [Achromobacter phage vB_AchrS_AchV4]